MENGSQVAPSVDHLKFVDNNKRMAVYLHGPSHALSDYCLHNNPAHSYASIGAAIFAGANWPTLISSGQQAKRCAGDRIALLHGRERGVGV